MKYLAYIFAFLWIYATAWLILRSYGLFALLFLGRTWIGAKWLDVFGWLVIKIDNNRG